LRGSLNVHEQGLIITTGDFSKGAITEASQVGKSWISLVNGNDLALLLMNHNIGVKYSEYKIFELNVDDLKSDGE
jgi:restriction system protein